MKSYLLERIFRVKFEKAVTQLKQMNSGVPQDSVLKLVLYPLYITDLPALDTIATYADDTTILAIHNNHTERSLYLQESLFDIQKWLKKWKIRINGQNLYK